jgi:hypothetical protein
MKTRIYVVHDADLDQRTLVRATHAAQAIAAVTRPRFAAAVATQEQLVRMLGDGETVTDASVAEAEPAEAEAA